MAFRSLARLFSASRQTRRRKSCASIAAAAGLQLIYIRTYIAPKRKPEEKEAPVLFSSWTMRTSLALAAAITAALSAAALAHDMAPCDQFAWPVKREQALFASTGLPHVASGATLESLPDRGIALELQPHDAAP